MSDVYATKYHYQMYRGVPTSLPQQHSPRSQPNIDKHSYEEYTHLHYPNYI